MVGAGKADHLLCPLVLLASFYSLVRLMIGLIALTSMRESERDEFLDSCRCRWPTASLEHDRPLRQSQIARGQPRWPSIQTMAAAKIQYPTFSNTLTTPITRPAIANPRTRVCAFADERMD